MDKVNCNHHCHNISSNSNSNSSNIINISNSSNHRHDMVLVDIRNKGGRGIRNKEDRDTNKVIKVNNKVIKVNNKDIRIKVVPVLVDGIMEIIMEIIIMSQRRTVQDLIGGILIMTSTSRQ